MMDRASREDTEEMLSRLFQEAMADVEGGRLAEAAGKLETVAAATRNPGSLWNLATVRGQLGQFDRAVAAWEEYRRMVPDDWSVRPRIIQMCHALGDTERLERERAELLALFRSGAHRDLSAERCYCREQFRIGDVAVLANEIFEPGGTRRVFYEFLIAKLDRTPVGRYSLGSYDSTTQLRRELGKIGPEERIYHLDWYDPLSHATYGFFSRLPSYDETRAQVMAAMTGALPWVSRVTITPGTWKPDIYLSQDVPAEARNTGMAHEMGELASGDLPSPRHPTPSSAWPPSPAPPDATRVATGGGAGHAGRGGAPPPPRPAPDPTPAPTSTPRAGERGGGGGGPFSALGSGISRRMGRRDDRPN